MKVEFNTLKDGRIEVVLMIDGMNSNVVTIFPTMEKASQFVIEVMKTQGMPH